MGLREVPSRFRMFLEHAIQLSLYVNAGDSEIQ